MFEVEVVNSDDVTAMGVAAGVAVGLAALNLVQAVVNVVIAPFIAVFIGASPLLLNSFTVNGSEFRYGELIEYAIIFALVVGAAILAIRWLYRGSQGGDSDPT